MTCKCNQITLCEHRQSQGPKLGRTCKRTATDPKRICPGTSVRPHHHMDTSKTVENKTCLKAFQKDPWGLPSSPRTLMEGRAVGLGSFWMVSEERRGPPGSSLTPLGTLRASPWGAESAQRPPSIFNKRLSVFHCCDFEHPDDPKRKRIYANAPEPLYHVYIGNWIKLLCHVDSRWAIKMGHLGPQVNPRARLGPRSRDFVSVRP